MKLTNTEAIRTYFAQDGGRTVTLQEIKELTPADRAELGQLAAKELGAEIIPVAGALVTAK